MLNCHWNLCKMLHGTTFEELTCNFQCKLLIQSRSQQVTRLHIACNSNELCALLFAGMRMCKHLYTCTKCAASITTVKLIIWHAQNFGVETSGLSKTLRCYSYQYVNTFFDAITVL